MYFEPLNLKT